MYFSFFVIIINGNKNIQIIHGSVTQNLVIFIDTIY